MYCSEGSLFGTVLKSVQWILRQATEEQTVITGNIHVNKTQQLEGNIGRCGGGGKHSSGSIHGTAFCGLGFRSRYPAQGLKCAVWQLSAASLYSVGGMNEWARSISGVTLTGTLACWENNLPSATLCTTHCTQTSSKWDNCQLLTYAPLQHTRYWDWVWYVTVEGAAYCVLFI